MKVTIKGASKRYRRAGGGDIVALNDVTASFPPGQVIAVVGRSGSGKSTLIRLLSGLESPDSGSVKIGSIDTLNLSSRGRLALRRQCISVIFQDHGLVADMTVLENLKLGLHISGRNPTGTGTKTALNAVGLDGFEKRFVSNLSGGEEQRVAIARSLLLEHPVLLADEPTGSLDAENAEGVFEALRSAADRGTTVIVATHDDVVYKRCDTVWRMEKGEMTRL